MKPDMQLTLAAFVLFCIAISCTANEPAAAGPTSTRPAVLLPPLAADFVPAGKDCEHDVLDRLGWQQAYAPAGYNIDAWLAPNCSTEAWQAMGCLKSLVNLTLAGQLPDLPNSWGANGSFPALQTMNFTGSSVAGSLPSSWALNTAFPELTFLDLSSTQLSGTLPMEWGQSSAFSKLVELRLGAVNITGMCYHCCSCKV